eukprot:2642724-Rhodomonas_salina.1
MASDSLSQRCSEPENMPAGRHTSPPNQTQETVTAFLKVTVTVTVAEAQAGRGTTKSDGSAGQQLVAA